MKLSNNAIKFLMAQYRAIYKNAYFKGIATAVVLTSALAAGQAQAAKDTNAVFGTQKVTDKTITSIVIDGEQYEAADVKNNLKNYTKIGVVDTTVTNDWLDVKITAGEMANNKVSSAKSAAKLTIKNLEIDAGAVGSGATVSGTAGLATLNVLDTITLTTGTLKLSGKTTADANGAVVEAKKIVLNNADANNAVLHIGGFAKVGNAVAVNNSGTITRDATVIDIAKKGTIKFSGTAAADSVLTGKFTGEGAATISFGDDKKGTLHTFGTLANASVSIGTGEAILEIENNAATPDDEGTLTITKGGINFAKGAAGKLSINKGNLVLGDEVTITTQTADAAAGGVVVGNGTNEATLTVKKETVDSYLTATKKGMVDIKSTGTLIFAGTDAIDLSSLTVKGTATAGTISAADGAKIGAEKVVVSSALTDGATGGASTATIVAFDTLTLGNGSDASDTYKVKGFEAKNLTLKAGLGETAFKLADGVTLSSTKDIGLSKDGKKMLGADSGKITGDALNLNAAAAATALTIAAGNYVTVGQDITLTKGTLAVNGNTATVDINGSGTKVDSSLTVSGGTLTLAPKDGLIKVSGSHATLDLTKATDIKYTTLSTAASNNTVQITVADKGTLVVKGDQVEKLITKAGNDNKAMSLNLTKDGVLKVTDSLKIESGKLSGTTSATAPTKPVINFDAKASESGGILDVAQVLTITKADTEVNIGGDGKIFAQSIILTPDTANAQTKLGSGNYTITQSIGADSDSGLALTQADSKLNLGKLNLIEGKTDRYTTVVGADATIDSDITSSGSINVQAGNWTAIGDLNITAGTVTVGKAANKDADGNIIKTSLTVEGKLTAAGVTVAKDSTLNAKEVLGGAASAISVSGTASIAGKAGKDTDATGLFGVSGAAGSIKVTDGGVLNFTDTAMNGFYFSGDALLNDKLADTAIDTELGAQVNLNYASGTELTDAQLSALTKKFDDGQTIHGIVNLGDATLKGLTPNEQNQVSWTDANQKYGNYLAGYQTNDLKSAQLIDVSTSGTGGTATEISGHFGSVKTDATFDSGASLSVEKKGGLYNAAVPVDADGKPTGTTKYFVVNASGDALGIKLDDKTAEFALGGEGTIDHVAFGGSGTLAIDKGAGDVAGNVTVTKNISGGATSAVNIKNGQLTVVGEGKKAGVNVGVLKSEAGTSLKTSSLSLTSTTDTSFINGDVVVDAESGSKITPSTSIGRMGAEFGGKQNVFAGKFESAGDLAFLNGGSTAIKLAAGETAKVTGDLEVYQNARLEVSGVLNMAAGDAILGIGEYHPDIKDENSSGFLRADYLALGTNQMVLDPSYDSAAGTAVAEIGAFTSTPTAAKPADVSTITGDVIVGQNSALLVGMTKTGEMDLDSAREFLKSYQVNGNLVDPAKGGEVGALLYLNSQQKIDSGKQLIVDGTANHKTAWQENAAGDYDKATKYTELKNYGEVTASAKADLYLGKGSMLALGEGAKNASGSIVFAAKDAAVFAEENTRIVLDSDNFLKGDRYVTVFQDAGNNGVKILGTAGNNDIRVETINGLMYFNMVAGSESNGGTLTLDTTRAQDAFSEASAPMKDFLLAYTSQTANWNEFYNDTTGEVKRVTMLGDEADQSLFTIDQENGTFVSKVDEVTGQALVNTANYELVNVGTAEAPSYVVYQKAYNDFLEAVVRNTNGADADRVGRMGVFGGAAQATLTAAATTADAVSGRFGMGQNSSALTFADNGQGSGMWVTPVYRSADSDGFAAEGIEYGADVNLVGVALGGDYSLGNGLRVGGMLNIGSGDADGQGAAQGVTNDFNYFGGALYAGYALDSLSFVADLSYTNIDSDVDVDTLLGKASTSFDTTAISAGVTGQYTMDFSGVHVAPHAGLRFTRLDMDNYTIQGFDGTEVGGVENSSANVFSLPVGVSISKEYAGEQWTIKPAFDLTLTANFGDDTVDSTVGFANTSNRDIATKSEFVDSFTYGTAIGVAAKSGNLGMGFGLSYTGSSNVKEFGANANVRYVF
ncbi:autotransporter outer membrane beta-barrel domain-containing protein [Anaerobiospirillum sp. NML120449]|uniref:autotransporter domain-containing protein n=1 Tax=Anaerobiospirillum sp. NML120449 TaxID=2932817 RepID=UPI001FF52E1F|nr:autotransporter outer membrane beta-barrel domain-containing protein [Anaerobiospirillum sp. NML120449]MCK0526478.1 autotransporter outer membrane beta-barrel domain-containing protein [Anaerobiospirillum sp. NML120449]